MKLAHRGDWRAAPENTLAAFRAALAVPGCDGLEFDVRFAIDGTPVLLHDPTLWRVQGIDRPVADMTVAELGAVGVATLAEVLAAMTPNAFLDIELKAMPTEELFQVIDAARGGAGSPRGLYRAAVSSFDADALALVTARRPGWARWLNAPDLAPATIGRAVDLGCAAIAALWRSIDDAGFARASDAGLEVVAWTVRRRPTAARLDRLGVLGICVEGRALDP